MYSMNVPHPVSGHTPQQLIDLLAHARGKLDVLVDGLPAEGWLGPRAEHLNPPLWELGHVAWFQERWCLRAREDGHFDPGLLPGTDALYDSSTVPHDSRWSLPLLPLAAARDYAGQVKAAVEDRLKSAFSPELAYFAELCAYHELMHIEAWWMAFQNLGYAVPERPPSPVLASPQQPRLAFDAGEAVLGSGPEQGFIFDNEKWRHAEPVAAFDIDAQPLSETAFAAFVDAGGYRSDVGWSEAGLAWRRSSGAAHPLYWKRDQGQWRVRQFTEWRPLQPHAPVLHVSRHEAEACAAWMGRRLPTAGQWLRATGHAAFQWGAAWEWMREPFAPYAGFVADPYQDYSEPWFHTHGELRGGGPVTDPLLKRTGFRNFYLPHRRDAFSGFRTVGTG